MIFSFFDTKGKFLFVADVLDQFLLKKESN